MGHRSAVHRLAGVPLSLTDDPMRSRNRPQHLPMTRLNSPTSSLPFRAAFVFQAATGATHHPINHLSRLLSRNEVARYPGTDWPTRITLMLSDTTPMVPVPVSESGAISMLRRSRNKPSGRSVGSSMELTGFWASKVSAVMSGAATVRTSPSATFKNGSRYGPANSARSVTRRVGRSGVAGSPADQCKSKGWPGSKTCSRSDFGQHRYQYLGVRASCRTERSRIRCSVRGAATTYCPIFTHNGMVSHL